VSHAFQDRVRTLTSGELAHAPHRCFAALADDIGCAKRLAQSDPVRMAAEQDDAFRAATSGGDDAAQSDSTIANDCRRHAWPHVGANGRMMACRHDIGQGEQRGHERVVLADRQRHERAVRVWHPDCLALATIDSIRAVARTVDARRLQAFAAELAGAVGYQKRGDDELSDLQGLNIRADRIHDADELMAHAAARGSAWHALVGPQVAAADRGARHANHRVGWIARTRVRHRFNTHISSGVHDGPAHRYPSTVPWCSASKPRLRRDPLAAHCVCLFTVCESFLGLPWRGSAGAMRPHSRSRSRRNR
jgi:hypothetical protein